MVERDAQEIIASIKNAAADNPLHPLASLANIWGEQIEGYPNELKGAVLLAAFYSVVEWIDANCPNAWYRSLFLGG